jgi:hypothetical protein
MNVWNTFRCLSGCGTHRSLRFDRLQVWSRLAPLGGAAWAGLHGFGLYVLSDERGEQPADFYPSFRFVYRNYPRSDADVVTSWDYLREAPSGRGCSACRVSEAATAAEVSGCALWVGLAQSRPSLVLNLVLLFVCQQRHFVLDCS